MAEPRKILLLEDDVNLGLVVQEHLQMQGFAVTICADGEAGTEAVARESFDLCLVDVMMPRKDGFTFAREVRAQNSDLPLIFLTAKSLREDRIEGFRIGCDDYVTKPFSIEELLLRIRAVLRRSTRGAGDRDETRFTIGAYQFDSNRQVLKNGDNEQRLTPREAELLRLLCLSLNKTLPREQALREVWGDDSNSYGRSMDVFISKLRKYLRDDSRISIIAVHGKGFRLVVAD